MKDKGQITVFLSLVLISLLVLCLAAAEAARYHMDRARLAETAEGAMQHIKAEYHTRLFEEYHLLLLDKNCMGKGEGAIEESLVSYLEYTLPADRFSVEDVCLTDTVSVLDNDCEMLKQQIDDYMTIYMQAKTIETVSEAILNDNQTAEQVKQAVENGKAEESDETGEWEGEDPREQLQKTMKAGLLNVVLPEGDMVSGTKLDRSALPSTAHSGKKQTKTAEEIDISFSDIDRLEAELDMESGLADSELARNMKGALYALECFHSYTSEEDTDHVLRCEVEYLIAGYDNDYDNLSSVVNRIVLHRFPVNLAVLLTDAARMAEINAMALTLSMAPGITYGAAKYLLAACLSYGETLLEVRALLSGQKIPLLKKSVDWMLDFKNIGKLAELTTASYDGADGIGYEAFLLLFLAETNGQMYERMCDVMQLNICCEESNFRMEHCIHSFAVDFDITQGSREFLFAAQASY